MPIYEFICSGCGDKFEALFRGQDEEAPRCPSCGASDVKKTFSVIGGVSVKGGNACGSGTDAASCPTCGIRGYPSRQ